jgi:two-component system, chemotaxis family, sensor kinase Cph1
MAFSGWRLAVSRIMNESIDPTGCENEPITIPGSIQSHGVLLVLSGRALAVTQISNNSLTFFGVSPAEILGRPIADWIDADSIRVLDKAAGWEDPSEVNPLPIVLRAKPDEVFDGIIHRVDTDLVLELERGQPGVATSHVRGVLSSIQNSLSEIDVCRIAAEKTRLLTGFDRVMVYRFASDWSGEVVAEARADGVISYFGTHFPASDIPKQTRELYTRKLLGVIPDVSYTPVPLLALEQGPPLDMSLCVLRSVSPIHLEYLHNMEVVATLTISLVISGQLWGMIACHHGKPWFGPYALRQDCQLLGQVTAAVIGVRAGGCRASLSSQAHGVAGPLSSGNRAG